MEVHASAGDNFLGGDDFCRRWPTPACATMGLRREALPGNGFAGLLRRLELAKRELSGSESATVEFQAGDDTHRWTLDHGRFDLICEPLVQRLRAPLERAMRDAR